MVLDLQRVPIYHAPSFLIVITVVHLSQLRNPIAALLLTPKFIRISLVFLLIFFPCSNMQSRKLHHIESSCLLSLLWSVAVYVSLLFMTWTVLRYWPGILQTVPQFGYLKFFTCLDGGYGFLGKKTRGESCLITFYQGYIVYLSLSTKINRQAAFACFRHCQSPLPHHPDFLCKWEIKSSPPWRRKYQFPYRSTPTTP